MKDVTLLTCPNCKKMFKIVDVRKDNGLLTFITDFGDKFILSHNKNLTCISCNHNFSPKGNSLVTYDWVADMVFKVKKS